MHKELLKEVRLYCDVDEAQFLPLGVASLPYVEVGPARPSTRDRAPSALALVSCQLHPAACLPRARARADEPRASRARGVSV